MSTTLPTSGSKATSQHVKTSSPHHSAADDPDSDSDALFATLEAEASNPTYLAARTQQLANEHAASQPSTAAIIPGSATPYLTLYSDDEVLRFTTSAEKAVLHFFHADFARCATMDVHLAKLAEARSRFRGSEEDVRFARVDVKDAAFVVEKLAVRVLPCVIGFIGGVGVGRVVGFEGLGVWAGGREDGLSVTRALEEKLVELKICGRSVLPLVLGEGSDDEEEEEQKKKRFMGRRGIQQGGRKGGNEDDDEEWD